MIGTAPARFFAAGDWSGMVGGVAGIGLWTIESWRGTPEQTVVIDICWRLDARQSSISVHLERGLDTRSRSVHLYNRNSGDLGSASILGFYTLGVSICALHDRFGVWRQYLERVASASLSSVLGIYASNAVDPDAEQGPFALRALRV